MKRKIEKIDEDKCNGCGLCIPNCPEGALQIIDDKARLVSDLFCDGLGACIGHCPQGAILIEERETKAYNEKKVMKNIVKQGDNTIKAHLLHLKGHGEHKYLNEAMEFLQAKGIKNPLLEEAMVAHSHQHQVGGCPPAPSGLRRTAHQNLNEGGCPGSRMMDFRNKKDDKVSGNSAVRQESELRQWPVQLSLVPPTAAYFQDADLVIAADCVPFAYANFHNDFLKDKSLIIACPKLDDVEFYKQKLAQIFKSSSIKSINIVHMEVPCCFGLNALVEEALVLAKKRIPVKKTIISIQGEKK
ncbi:MAG: 4Fe-4S binding protein [Candidatus Omnitrophota bacterium]|nr:4Fe-4S binding protein [Candidatus Omnitrophota bacterium]